jgi:hypothetical protein
VFPQLLHYVVVVCLLWSPITQGIWCKGRDKAMAEVKVGVRVKSDGGFPVCRVGMARDGEERQS